MPFPYPVKPDADAGRATGRARNTLIAIGVASIAVLWLSPFAFFAAADLIAPPAPGDHGLAYAKFYSIQFLPAVALVSIALCFYAYLNYRPSRFLAIATFWAAVSGWWLTLFAMTG